MKSLKISEVHNYPNELLKRLRGVNSPGKRKLVQDIKGSNWEAVYEELLYRIELYAANKVVNYTRKDLAELVINIAQHQPAVLASALYEKNFGNGINVRSEFDIIGGDLVNTNFSGRELSKLISDLMASNKKTVTFMYVDEDSIISPEEAGVDDGSIIMLLNDDPTSNVFSFVTDLRDDSVTKKSLIDELSKVNDVDFVFDDDDAGGLSAIPGDAVQLEDDFLITDEVITELVDFVEQNLTGAIDESDGKENDYEIARNLSLLAINSYGDDVAVLSSDSIVNDPESEYYGKGLLDVIMVLVDAEIVDDEEDDEFFITDEVIAELVDFVEQNLPGSVDESDGAESEDEIIRNLSHLAINSYGDDTGFISSSSLVNDPESEYFGKKLLDVIIDIVNADDYYDDDDYE